jgi:hypothetical protein
MINRGLIHQCEKLYVSENVYINSLNVPIQFFFWVNIRHNEEKFENTNRVIRMTYNTMVKTNNDLHNITQKTNYRVTRTPLKTGDELLHI